MHDRTKKYFDGTAPTGKKISELLPGILDGIGRARKDDQEAIFRAWFFLIGEKMAHMTQPVSFKDGVLTIKVKSATLYALLCQHERPRLLKELQAKFQVRELVFRIG